VYEGCTARSEAGRAVSGQRIYVRAPAAGRASSGAELPARRVRVIGPDDQLA